MLKHNLFVLWNFKKVLISTKFWTSDVCLAPWQNPFQAYTFLSENTPWIYCKKEQMEIENSNFLPRWHLEGKFRTWTGVVLGSTLCLLKKRGNWNLSSYYLLWNKNTENQKDFASCECKSYSRMHFTGGPRSPRYRYPSRCEKARNVKRASLIFSAYPLHHKTFIFKKPKRDFNCIV